MAERNGVALRRSLVSEDRFSDLAIAWALLSLKTPDRRSIASLCAITRADPLADAVLLADVVLRPQAVFPRGLLKLARGAFSPFAVADLRFAAIQLLRRSHRTVSWSILVI